jgi:hypothetical protein
MANFSVEDFEVGSGPVDEIHPPGGIEASPGGTSKVQTSFVFVRVVDTTVNNEYWSDLLAIDLHDQGRDFIGKLQERKRGQLSTFTSWLKAFVDMFLMQEDHVFLVTVSLVSRES